MEPMSCGIGGDLFAIVWDNKTKKLYGLNASGRSPYQATRDYFKTHKLKEIPEYGPLSWSVPGCVSGWDELHQKFGKLPLTEILAPTIQYANGDWKELVLDDLKLDSPYNTYLVAGLPPDFPSVDAARHALRLYASLSAGQRGALWSGKSLAVERMTAPQLALLAAGAKGVGAEPVPPQLVGGAFWLTTMPFTRPRDQTGTRNDDGEHFLLAPNEARSIGTSPVTQPQAAAAGSPPSGAPFRLTRVAFFLGGGSGPLGECQLIVSSPP